MRSAGDYPSPPVHEVILSLFFQGAVDEARLEDMPAVIGDRFPAPERLEQTQTELVVSATGEATTNVTKTFEGWRFKDDERTRVLQAWKSRMTIHAVRPGKWPVGHYPGWVTNSAWAFGLLGVLADIYQGLTVRRVGLRYLNRIAIPETSDLTEWFAVTPSGPDFLKNLFTFNVTQTWAAVVGDEDLSATVRLVKIQIDDAELAKDNVGVLLDIEVFNLVVDRAPRFDQLEVWFNRAHDVENRIFEAYINDSLRQRFGGRFNGTASP